MLEFLLNTLNKNWRPDETYSVFPDVLFMFDPVSVNLYQRSFLYKNIMLLAIFLSSLCLIKMLTK